MMDLAAFRRSLSALPVTIDDVLACHPLADNRGFIRLVAHLANTFPAPPSEVIRIADGLFAIGVRDAHQQENRS